MNDPIEETEVYQWVERHFKRMGWKVTINQGPCFRMATIRVREPKSRASASCPVFKTQFNEPANKTAPVIIQAIALAFGEFFAGEKKLALGLRRAAKALGTTTDALLDSLKSKTTDVEINNFMETIGGDDSE